MAIKKINKGCGETPTISRVCPDGTMIEIIYDGVNETTALAVCAPDGTVSIVPQFDLPTGERLIPYSAQNNLLTSGCVLLPGDVGDFGDKGDLVAAVRAYIHRYVDLSPNFEEIATHYVLLSWVYDAFNELPYLRFRGDFGTGKTRALLTIGSISYKPFFASGASTVSPIFHVIDRFGGTLVLDEADFRFSDATADLTKILNNGNMNGLPVLRTMTNKQNELDPKAFKVFGPKLVGMRTDFTDQALESRFLTEETGVRPLRPDISIHLPGSLKADALILRNRLLAWRFHARHTVGPDPSRLVSGVSPRFNQTALALLSIVDDADLRQRIARELVGSEARVLAERATSIEATVLAALCEALVSSPSGNIPLADIASRYTKRNADSLKQPVTNKWIGHIVRKKLRLSTVKSHGTFVIPWSERSKIMTLAARHGIGLEAATIDIDATDVDFRAKREFMRGAHNVTPLQ